MMTDTTNDRRMLRTMIEGYQLSQALAVMAHLGIADLLGSDTTSIDELATTTSADHDALRRLLRAARRWSRSRIGHRACRPEEP